MAKEPTKIFIKNQKLEIEQERIRVLAQIEELKKNDPFADPEHASDNAAIDTDVREQVGHETIEAQIKDLHRKVVDMDLALTKVEKGTYGRCEKCSMPIPLARLELIPEARFCIDCERKLFK